MFKFYRLTDSYFKAFLTALACLAFAALQDMSAQEIELRYSEGLMLTWNDDGSGGDNDGAFWAPFIPRGFFAINHTARSNYNSPSLNLFVARALREDSRPLAAPIGYELIWTDSGSGADRDGAFWKPIAPPGYVSLGTVGTGGGRPGLSEILCVRRDLVEVGGYGARVYNDAGSGADANFSAWNVVAPANCIHLASYVGHAGYGIPDEVPYCLKKSAVLELPYNSRVGSVDERLARPQSPIAADAGQWGGATTRFEELVFTPGAGMLGNYYEDCAGTELYHVQHVVRLPNKDGRAYFAVTQSRAHNGWLSVMRTYPDRIDPVTDRVIPSDSGSPIGEYVWQDVYGGPALGQVNPIGNWNHPCKMELIGNVLVVIGQNWEATAFCKSQAMGVSEDALLFYDVRDPENPVYWGMIPAYELGMGNDPNRDILDGFGILRDPQSGKYILRAQGTNTNVSWTSDTISPDIGDWRKLESLVGTTGQHGMLFNSFQINTEPGRIPRERVMWYQRGERGHEFYNLVNSQASIERSSNSVVYAGGLPGADRDWDASSLYVTRRGVPIIYGMRSTFGEIGRLYQVTDSRNNDLKTPRPDQLVTTALDGGKGSLRWAIGKGGVIQFDASLDGKILDLRQGPLVNYLHTVVVDASNLERGITIRGGAHKGPVFILGRETSATLRNITLTGGRAIVGGGILNEGGSLHLENCTVSGCQAQQGGGLANMRSASTRIIASTIHSNQASFQGGGIINDGGFVYMLNSTIWNNYGAQKSGAGLLNQDGGDLRLVHATVSGNRIDANLIGAGITNFDPSSLTMVNSIVAGNENLAGGVSADIQGDVLARGPNLVEGEHLGRVLEGPAFIKGDPMFGPFDGRVLRLQAGSPAIDAAEPLVETDQLGSERSMGAGPDLGAYEAPAAEVMTRVLSGEVFEFASPDDLDLNPERAVIAIDMYGNQASRVVNGISFLNDVGGTANDNGVNVTTYARNFIDNWAAAPLLAGGDGASSFNLAEIMRDIRWGPTNDGIRILIEGLDAGLPYEIQLLTREITERLRSFDIEIEDELVVDNYSSNGVVGRDIWSTSKGFGWRGTIIAPEDGEISIIMKGDLGGEPPLPGTDGNPILQAMIVQRGVQAKWTSLGTGANALLGGDLTDPEDDGVDAGGVDDFSKNGWNLVNVIPNEEPGFGGGEFAFNIFDNQLGGGNAKWCCNARDITFEFEAPVSVTHFTIASADDVPNRDWRVFRVQGSNDGTTFETFYESSGEERLWKERLEVLRFDLTMMTDPYRFIRFEADSNWGDTLWQIGEIEVFGDVIPMPRVHYPFNEGMGRTLMNLGSGADGRLVNAPSNPWQEGSPDGTGYLRFNEDGAGSTAMYVTTDLSMDSLTDYTMMAWIQFENNAGDNMIFGQLGTGVVLHNGARNTSYHLGHWGNDLTAGTIEVGVWHHVAYRYAGGTQSIFVDGIEVASAVRGPVTNTSDIVIGGARSDVDWDFAGGLDDVRIYDVALSAKNIASLARPGRVDTFAITGIQANQDGSITLSWPEIAGKNYEVSYTTDLKDGFQAIVTDLSGGSFTDTNRGIDEPMGYYRVTELD
ncbi:Vps62-related protein [Verrucomicrobia bacterium]|nr:Vps62-related protein [Verrucomicrobiota bacterium]